MSPLAILAIALVVLAVSVAAALLAGAVLSSLKHPVTPLPESLDRAVPDPRKAS